MRKGIILAGGTGSRLFPVTKTINKHLIPIFDKPMIYYPLTTLMLSGIREIMLITNEKYQNNFKDLLGDGSQFGIKITYGIQKKPAGIADGLLVAENFIKENPCALILGDNLFYGAGLKDILENVNKNPSKSTIIGHQVKDPKRYGIVEFNEKMQIKKVTEKPKKPKTNFAVTGLYFYDNTAIERIKNLSPSSRGELEITSLNDSYLKDNKLSLELLQRGMTWIDAGTIDSLLYANTFISTIQNRQGIMIGSPEELSWRLGWINDETLRKSALKFKNNFYGSYLKNLKK